VVLYNKNGSFFPPRGQDRSKRVYFGLRIFTYCLRWRGLCHHHCLLAYNNLTLHKWLYSIYYIRWCDNEYIRVNHNMSLWFKSLRIVNLLSVWNVVESIFSWHAGGRINFFRLFLQKQTNIYIYTNTCIHWLVNFIKEQVKIK